MKGFKLLVLLAIATSLVACSNNRKKAKDANQISDSASTILTDDADFIVDSEDEDLLLADESSNESLALTPQPTETTDILMDDSFSESTAMTAPVIETTGNMGTYTVESGDTLMLVAFKIYGDYRKWREIARHNPSINGQRLTAGTVLSYDMPMQRFDWSPKGQPYLVKSGDTLGTISNDKYGTTKRWRDIYNNNQPMIRDPNLIFAGFTLYYQPDRDVASESW